MVNDEDAAKLNALRTKETHWLKAITAVEDPVRERLLKAAQKAGPKVATAQALGRVELCRRPE